MSLQLLSAFSLVKKSLQLKFNLRKSQQEILDCVISKKNVLAVLPTGYGKSLCYQLPPLLLDQIIPTKRPHHALVISPLRSLMLNQRDACHRLGISAVCIMPEMTPEEKTGFKDGQYSVILSSPEAIVSRMDTVRSLNICVIAVDEVHCVVQWGESIRTTYKELPQLQSFLSGVPWLLATATATDVLKEQFLKTLQLQHTAVTTVAVLPDRPEIFLILNDQPGWTVTIALSNYVSLMCAKGRDTPKAILYCKTLNQVGNAFLSLMQTLGDKRAYYLSSCTDKKSAYKRIVGAYHGNVGTATEKYYLEEFAKPDSYVRLMICTCAFGMGVDIPDVRYVFHWGPPKTLLAYWQEVGRAARDGHSAEATLFSKVGLQPKPEPDMQTFVRSVADGKCIRIAVLEGLAMKEMPTDHLQELREDCSSSCTDCACHACRCCSVCRDKCPCRD